MFYEISLDGAGFLPAESLRMDVDGLFARICAFVYIFKGQQGILLINDSAALSIASIVKQTTVCGSLTSLTIVSTLATLSEPRIDAIRDAFPEIQYEHISTDSIAEHSLIVDNNGKVNMDNAYIDQHEFNIITPPEREKRAAINTLNRLFAPLARNEVHVDVQFNGERYLAEPHLQFSQQKMKSMAALLRGDTMPYLRALHDGLCRGLFDLAPLFSKIK